MNVARSHAVWVGLSLTLVCACASAHTALTVVAAENFYGDVARQLGAPDTKIIDVLSKPDADPHLYEASPSIARAVSTADLVIYNGLNYDPWDDAAGDDAGPHTATCHRRRGARAVALDDGQPASVV